MLNIIGKTDIHNHLLKSKSLLKASPIKLVIAINILKINILKRVKQLNKLNQILIML